MRDLERIRRLEDDLMQVKEGFVIKHGWHKEKFQGFRCVEVYWCKDEDALSGIDDVIDLIEKSLT